MWGLPLRRRAHPAQSIFPAQVVLSPGESSRLGIVGVDGFGQSVSDPIVQWHIDSKLGEITPFAEFRAGRTPGVFPGAIRALVTLEREGRFIVGEVSADLVIRGPLGVVTIEPSFATVEPGGRVQFQALGWDVRGILLPDVSFRWTVVDENVGTIDSIGSFVAGQALGTHRDVVKVVAVQHGRA